MIQKEYTLVAQGSTIPDYDGGPDNNKDHSFSLLGKMGNYQVGFAIHSLKTGTKPRKYYYVVDKNANPEIDNSIYINITEPRTFQNPNITSSFFVDKQIIKKH